jgi:hypothetical protein
MGQERSPCAPAMGAAPHAGPRGPPRDRSDRGRREPAATEPRCPRVGLARAGPAAIGQAHRGAAGREPVPGAEACTGHTQPVPRGRQSVPHGCRSGRPRAVEHACSVVAHKTDGQTAGVQVEATVPGGLGGEAHEVPCR